MKPALKAGAPVEASVKIPIEWDDLRQGSTFADRWPDDAGRKSSPRVVVNLPWSTGSVGRGCPRGSFRIRPARGKVSGLATLDCTMAKTGAIGFCTILQEEPGAYGFGAAARRPVGQIRRAKLPNSAGAQLAGAHGPPALRVRGRGAGRRYGRLSASRSGWRCRGPEDLFVGLSKGRPEGRRVQGAGFVLACAVAGAGVLGRLPGGRARSRWATGLGQGDPWAWRPPSSLAVWSAEGLPTVGGKVAGADPPSTSRTIGPRRPRPSGQALAAAATSAGPPSSAASRAECRDPRPITPPASPALQTSARVCSRLPALKDLPRQALDLCRSRTRIPPRPAPDKGETGGDLMTLKDKGHGGRKDAGARDAARGLAP